jgi:predicted nuclease with TOPRIM domain
MSDVEQWEHDEQRAMESEISRLRAENDRLLCELADEQNRVAKLRRAMDEVFPPAHLLALELECLLMDTKDTAAQSKWWEPAHNALEQWREYCRADDDGRQGKTFMGEPVIVTPNVEVRGR